MHLWQAIIEGLVQGLTEFLPVSSSAHLVFADHFLHLHLSEADTVYFDIMLHLGTLVAVVLYFYKDIWQLLRGAGQLLVHPRAAWAQNASSRLFVWLALGTIPAAIAGKVLKPFFEAAFQNVPGTAAMLLVTAVMLFWITRRATGGRTMEKLTWKDAALVGLFQAVAILPGISRSGSTITGGLMRGLDRDTAPRFSFLLSIPIILGGGLLEVKDVLHTGTAIGTPLLVAGFITAAISGYLAVVLLLGIVRRGRLDRFAYYCVAAGVLMLAYWTLLVPKVSTIAVRPVSVTDLHGLYPANAAGEVGPIELGESVQFEVDVTQGVLPVETVYALLPQPAHTHDADAYTAKFGRLLAGKTLYVSEKYKILPLGSHYEPIAAGEVRDIWVIVRNKWGIQNEVRLRVRVVPESLQSRTA